LKEKAFSTFLDQNPPFELRPSYEIHRAHPSTGPTLQFPSGGGQQGWLAFAPERKGDTFESCRAPQYDIWRSAFAPIEEAPMKERFEGRSFSLRSRDKNLRTARRRSLKHFPRVANC
jgi:hypothetical protein